MPLSLTIVDGPMGSGKSTVGGFLRAGLPRTAALDTGMIKRFVSDFEPGERDNAIAAQVLFAMCESYLKQGVSVLLPQAFWRESYLRPYVELALRSGAALHIYRLEGSEGFLLDRIRGRNASIARDGKAVPSEERIAANLKTWRENRYELGTAFDIEKMSSRQIADAILKDISK